MLKRHGCIRAMALGLLIFAPTLTSAQIQDEGFHELQRQEGVMVEEFDERAARPDNTQEYFTLDESTSKSTAEWMDPGTALEIFDEVVYETMAAPISLSLLKWVRHFKAPPSAHEAYNRRKHFGGWVNEPNDNDCHNVRAKILIRDSLRKVTYSETNPCVVSKGLWKDPYTGALLDDARRQI